MILDRCCEHLKAEGFRGSFFMCVQILCDFMIYVFWENCVQSWGFLQDWICGGSGFAEILNVWASFGGKKEDRQMVAPLIVKLIIFSVAKKATVFLIAKVRFPHV